jgi:hypothetical protein
MLSRRNSLVFELFSSFSFFCFGNGVQKDTKVLGLGTAFKNSDV